MTASSLKRSTDSAAQTEAFGSALAGWLEPGDIVLLHGDLGAGKTTLAKGIAAALGIDAVVSSPSFALINEYDIGPAARVPQLVHIDLYRLQDEAELDSIGFADYVHNPDGVTLVEWPERAACSLPARYILIELEYVGADRRHIRVSPYPPDDSWARRFESLRTRIDAEGSAHPS
jgi:tRNA threonylcarbamoyladenosine biosynthesis protein TsaE